MSRTTIIRQEPDARDGERPPGGIRRQIIRTQRRPHRRGLRGSLLLGLACVVVVGTVGVPLHAADGAPTPEEAVTDGTNMQTIIQRGPDNQKTVRQRGQHNDLTLIQEGTRNAGTIDQAGQQNQAESRQTGEANQSRITQDGHGNRATIRQQGGANRATIQQGH
jgi:hypothetical protein